MAQDLGAIHWADRLTESTRHERRVLLGVSFLAVTLIHGGMVPERIDFLGVELTTDNQVFLFRSLAVVIAYFLVSFLLYAIADHRSWVGRMRTEYGDSISPDMKRAWQKLIEQTPILTVDGEPVKRLYSDDIARVLADAIVKTHTPANRWSHFGGWVRFLFDFAIPISLGIYAICLLLTTSQQGNWVA